MTEFDDKVAELRARLLRIGRKYAAPRATRALFALAGAAAATEHGEHWELEEHWDAAFRHGSVDVGALSELPPDALDVLMAGGAGFSLPADRVEAAPPQPWVFLDTETTGLAGGSGTLAFLIGAGWIAPDGFRLKQYFLRDHGEEKSALAALSGLLAPFDTVVTYNGKAFDVPLLETRYRLARLPSPFARLRHLDLLHSARRLWKLKLERCRLQDLERRILGVERHDDVDGALIPELYFRFLRSGDASPLRPVFRHNAIDVLSLGALTAIVPQAFREPFHRQHGAELVGLGRWLQREGRVEEALGLFRKALGRALPDALAYQTLWQVGAIEKKLGRREAAVAAWAELATAANPWQAEALEQLAIYYERHEKNPTMALEMTQSALALAPSESLRRRAARLERPRTARLL